MLATPGSCKQLPSRTLKSGRTRILRWPIVAKCGQYFDARFQILAPVNSRGGVPDVLLRFANCWRRIDRYEFVVAADKEITGVYSIPTQRNRKLR